MAWFTTTHIAENTYRFAEPFDEIKPDLGASTTNMYLVLGQERAALIDTGMGIGDVRAEVRGITALPCTVLNTHFHWDHVGGNALFAESAIHEVEAGMLAQEHDIGQFRQLIEAAAARGALPPAFDPAAYRIHPEAATRLLRDGDHIDLGGRVLRVLHVPGHSPGHVAYLDAAGGLLFTGDTALPGPNFACFEGGDPVAFARSTRRLAALPDVTTVCPGHNDPLTDPDWLALLAGCVEAAVSGQAEGQLRDDFFVGREFRFGPLSVWLPQ